MVTAILYANNLRDLRNDATKGFLTLPMLLGDKAAPWFYYGLVAVSYGVPIGLAAATRNAWWLLPLASAPLEGRLVQRIRRGFPEHLELLLNIDVACAQTHLAYGVLMVAAILLAALPGGG